MSINRTVISGNLTRDPDEKRTQGGMCIIEFGVAVNERRKDSQTGEWEDKANFIECTMFGKRAEGILQYLAKGMHVTVEGHLRQERWEKDGQKFSRLKVIVDEIDFSGNRRQDQPEPQREQQDALGEPEQTSMHDDDIPF